MNRQVSLIDCAEAVSQTCSAKKVFLEISQNSQENTCVCNFIKIETLAQTFSCEFYEISKNTFSYRTPPVAASDWDSQFLWKFILASHKWIIDIDQPFY